MKKQFIQFYIFLLIIIAYLASVIFISPNKNILQHYQLTTTGYWLIISSITLVLVVIWLTAYYGSYKLNQYTSSIRRNKDGRAVSLINKGVMILVFQLPITSISSTLLRRMAQYHTNLIPTTSIILHYIQLVLPLVAFIYISFGARALTEMAKQRPSLPVIYMLSLLFIVVGGAFSFFLFRSPNTGSIYQVGYFLPNWLLFFTILVPTAFTWFISVLAAYELFLFNRKAPGIVYRRSWELLAIGLIWLIVIYIAYQFLSLLSNHLTKFGLSNVLLLIYGLLVVLVIGFIFVAAGANKLYKIEKV